MLYFLVQLLYLCGFIFIGNGLLYLVYYQLLTRYNQKFRELKRNQKFYILKNLSKSTMLIGLAIFTTPLVYELVQTGVWLNELITFIGHIYVSTDVAGLIFVPKLPFTTQLHHTVVFICGIANILVDYNQPGIHRALIALTYFSILPYLVNTLLGLRHLGFPRLKKNLAIVCCLIYGPCITINCIIQHTYIFYYSEDWIILRLAYFVLYHIIFYDDRKLMRYLYKVANDPYDQHQI